MEREDLLALAQRGHTGAIAALLNQQLKYRGMHCRVVFIDQVLHVMVSAEGETPDRGATLEFLRAKIINLDIEHLTRVRLYGLAPGADPKGQPATSVIPDHPQWTQEFALAVGDYSCLAAAIVPEDQPSQASQTAKTPQTVPIETSPTSPSHRSPKLQRSHRQPTTTSLAIVAITLGLIVFSGYKLIARNARSVPTPPTVSDPVPTNTPTP